MRSIRGTAGPDDIVGTAADETIDPLAGNDTVRARGGDDLLVSSRGADFLDGGSGVDTVTYAEVTFGEFRGGIEVDLFRNVAFSPQGTDTLVRIENIVGSDEGGDVLGGDERANRIDGLGGEDHIRGEQGDDLLFGGEDQDTFRWLLGDGSDRVDGGASLDSISLATGFATGTDFSLAPSGRGLVARAFGEGGATLRLEGIEGLAIATGGDGASVMIGDLSNTDLGRVDFERFVSYGRVVVDIGGQDVLVDGRRAGVPLIVDGPNASGEFLGGSGDDIFQNSIEAVTVRAGAGHDVVIAGGNTDVVSGGRGDDVIEGGGGDDLLRGDQGRDTFAYAVYDGDVEGQDTILDFGEGDRVLLSGASLDIGRGLDTNRDGVVGRGDRDASLAGGSLEIDLSRVYGFEAGYSTVTFANVRSINPEDIVAS